MTPPGGGEPEWLRILRKRERREGLVPAPPEPPRSTAPPPGPYGAGGPAPPSVAEAPPPGTGEAAPPVFPAHGQEPPRLPAEPPSPIPGILETPTAGGPGHKAEERRRVRTHGILLATVGLVFALLVVLGLKILALSPISYVEWTLALVATAIVQLVVWWIPHRSLDEHLRWDRHYTYTPMLAAAFLLSLYMYLAVETVARLLILMSWFVALLFTAGLVGFGEVAVLSGAMTAGYLIAARLLAARGLLPSFAFEVIVAGVFFGICVFAAVVFRRLHQERREARLLKQELTEQALTDPLTGLANRREFERIMLAELDRIRRYGGSCTVAMIDVDYFKNYNDTLGHPAGDALLKELTAVIRIQLRQSDFFARVGGDEFTLVMVNTPGLNGLDVMERLRRHLETHRFSDEEIQPGGSVTISVGLASFPENGSTYEELIGHADEALYVAKSRGRNRVCGP